MGVLLCSQKAECESPRQPRAVASDAFRVVSICHSFNINKLQLFVDIFLVESLKIKVLLALGGHKRSDGTFQRDSTCVWSKFPLPPTSVAITLVVHLHSLKKCCERKCYRLKSLAVTARVYDRTGDIALTPSCSLSLRSRIRAIDACA